MGSRFIGSLRILAYIIWIISTLIGTLMFYNLTNIHTGWNYQQSETRLVVNVDISYNGYVFELKFFIEIKLYDKNNNIIARDSETVYMMPGDKKTITLVLEMSDPSLYDHGKATIRVDQLIRDIDIIGLMFTYNL